jgi:hypothetical protein
VRVSTENHQFMAAIGLVLLMDVIALTLAPTILL